MKNMIKMIAVLTTICGISGFALSYLKITTAPRIEEQILLYVQQPALIKIFPNTENSPLAERKNFSLPDGKIVTVFPIKKNGTLIGVALESSSKGYGGNIGVMVGFELPKDRIVGIGITTMQETPGLGTLIAEPYFTKQFINIAPPVALKKQGGTIDAVSGATISSSGAVTAVAKAIKIYTELKPELIKWQ